MAAENMTKNRIRFMVDFDFGKVQYRDSSGSQSLSVYIGLPGSNL